MNPFYEDYADYVRGVIPLMIFHLWFISRRQADPVPLEQGLEKCVDILRKTTIHPIGGGKPDFSHPEWITVKEHISALFQKHKADPASLALEKDCRDYLWPLMTPRFENDSRPPGKGPDRPFGCWKYEFRKDELVIHIDNAFRPESPFTTRLEEFADDLRRLIRQAKSERPEVTILMTGTWMVQFPPFQAMFPPRWIDNIHNVREFGSGQGTWGQYMTRRGSFHRPHGRIMRETGRHPYPISSSRCDINEALGYLEREEWRNRKELG